MTPNQTKLRRAKHFLAAIDDGCNEIATLFDLIEKAQSAPPSPDAELVELLRECRGIVAKEVERWNKVAAFLLEDGSVKSGLLARIDAKLDSLK